MANLTRYVPPKPAVQREPCEFGELQELAGFWSVFLRRRRLFAAVCGGFVLAVALATVLTPKTYTTTTQIMAGSPSTAATNNNSDTALPVLNALVLQSGAQSAETFALLAQQEDVAAAVTRDLNLKISPSALLGHVTVKPVVNTAILGISVKWRDPRTSAAIANAFATAFISRERDFVRSQATAALGFLSAELPKAEAQMRQSSSELARFQAANGFLDAGTHVQDVVSQSSAIESKIAALSLDRREAQALLANAGRQLDALAPTIDNAKQISVNPVIADLRSKLEDVDLQLANARAQYTDQHPAVISLKKQRAALLSRISSQPETINSGNTLAPNPLYQSLQQQAAGYQQRIDGDGAQIALLQTQRAQMAPLLRRLPQQGVELATLQQRAKLALDVYNALEQKFNDATIARSTAISDVTIVQAATVDSAVASPNLILNMAVALVAGLILGGIVIVIVDSTQHTVGDDADAGDLTGLPIIARIPSLSTTNRHALPWLQSMTVEAFLKLCVALKLKNKQPIRTLAITSPCRGDGKSTIAFNLAKAMANLQSRVLLVDADLRCPTLHDLAQRSNRRGLSDVLGRHVPLTDCVQEIAPKLDLLASGHSVENPVALLESADFYAFLKSAEELYSMVIIDTPALTAVTDGVLVCSRMDAAALVISANSTSEREAKLAIAQFQALGVDNFVGVVLNRDPKRVIDYSDYFARSFGPALPGGSSDA